MLQHLSRRGFGAGAIAFMAGVSATRSVALAQGVSATPDVAFVDPELRPVARRLIAAPRVPLSPETLTSARATAASLARAPLATPPFVKRYIKGPPHAPDIAIYIINAAAGASRPAILHIHGGGFVVGSALAGVRALQEIALALGCLIVTVEYRLAPETTFSGSTEDNYAALRWLHDNAASLGADQRRIAVMGESAGGGHAALLTAMARDRGEVPLIFQCLSYPMLDDRTGATRTPPAPIGTLAWTADRNRFGWRSFLGTTPGTAAVPAEAVPARHASLAGLPPAFIGVGSIDLFLAEDQAYSARLRAAGVETELLVVPGAFHGFDVIAPQTSIARNFVEAKIDALRRAFDRTA